MYNFHILKALFKNFELLNTFSIEKKYDKIINLKYY